GAGAGGRAAGGTVAARVRSAGAVRHPRAHHPALPVSSRWLLGEERVAELAGFLRAVPSARFSLTHVGRFAGQVGRSPGVLYLAPDPAEPFVDLTRQLVARFDLLPYGRASSGGNPHLTVARHEDPA